MAEQGKDREFVTALARGLSVIQVFDRDHPELTLSEVAKRAKLSPGTARRCLWTLQALGYVGTNGKRYLLRPKVITLGSGYLDAAHVDELILPYLRELVTATGESSVLAVLDEGDVLPLTYFSARRVVRFTMGVGSRFPAYATAIGRALLAQLPEAELDRQLERMTFRAFTSRTIGDADGLRAALDKTRADGFAMAVGELEEGLTSIAVPVHVNGRAVAAINCATLQRGELPAETLAAWLTAIRNTAHNVAGAVSRDRVLLHSLAAG